jgi:hypothetical protein
VIACLLAFAAGTADGASGANRASFSVTLQGTVTKEWNTTAQATEDGCPVSIHSVGRRVAKLRSARPTTVVATFADGRVSYSPALVRHVVVDATQSGTQTTRVQTPCRKRSVNTRCRRAHRAVGGGTFRFFRSARDEISFHNVRLVGTRSSCPRESSRVRAIMPGLRAARGELSEVALMNPRSPSQTALASAEAETILDGAETGRVLERMSWQLTFTRKR